MFDQKSHQCYTTYIMKTVNLILNLPRVKRRAIELYARDTPFRPQREQNRMVYNRKVKHRNRNEH